MDAAIEVAVSRVSHDASLCFIVPNGANATGFWAAKAAFKLLQVAYAVVVLVDDTIASTDANGIKLIAFAIALPLGDTIATTNAAFIEHAAIAVTEAFRDAKTVANTARIEFTDAFIDIITNFIVVLIRLTSSAAIAQGIIEQTRTILICGQRLIVAS